MLTNEDIAAFLEAGYEIRSVEFKGPGSTQDSAFIAKVARAALALANQRDGGFVIIGVDEADELRSGLSPEQTVEWLNYDDVVDKVNKYADPPLRLDRAHRELPDGRGVVVLRVAEFDQIPVLAAKDYPRVIQRGQLYTRSFRKPESSADRTQNELREVLDLATQKQLARFLALANSANLTLNGTHSAESRYEKESNDYLATAAIADITSDAHFHFSIRPGAFEPERIEYTEIREIVRKEAVHVRGWPYPFVTRPQNGPNWISEEETVMHRESWVAFESGQFQSWHALPLDGRHRIDRLPDPDRNHGYFAYWMPVAKFTEVITFAQRLQLAVAPTVPYRVTLSLIGAKGWELVPGDPRRRPFYDDFRLSTDTWERVIQLPAGGGAVSARVLAIPPSVHLLRRFGWAGANEQIMRSVQEEAFGDS